MTKTQLSTFNNGICEICGKKFKGKNGVARHIQWFHKLSLEDFFLSHGGSRTICECGCGKPTFFLGTNMKYSQFATQHCAAVVIPRRPRNKTYRNNISNAMKKVWIEKTDEEMDNISNTMKKMWAKRTDAEKARIFKAPGKSIALHSDDVESIFPDIEQICKNLDTVFGV